MVTVGRTVDEAVYLFAALDRQCHVQLMAEAAAANGIPKTIISPEDAEFTAKTIQWWENTYVNVSLLPFDGPQCPQYASSSNPSTSCF